MISGRLNILGLSPAQLAELPVLQGVQEFRLRQIYAWVYARGAQDFAEMTDLPGTLRERLAAMCSLQRLPVLATTQSADKSTRKLLFGVGDELRIEGVLMRAEGRDTLCISSQVGCAHGCRFCATGAMGLARNLTPYEIVSQVLVMRDELLAMGAAGHFNLVFMGMGEPLSNYEALVHSLEIMNESHGLAVGRRRMTISTVGLPPQIRRLSQEKVTVRLALSLNATTNPVRDRLMPINRRYPIEQVMPALAAYGRTTGNRVTLEYVLLKGWNDKPEDARRLADLATRHGCKINLIVFNTHSLSDLEPTDPETARQFHDALLPIAPAVTLRESRGGDIRAACGQLSTAYRE